MTKRKRYLSIFKGGLLGLLFFLAPSPAWARDCVPDPIPPDFNIAEALVCILGGAIDSLFALVVPIAAILLIFGGFRYMASGGDQRALESSRKFITWVIIGTVLALGAVFVFRIIESIIARA